MHVVCYVKFKNSGCVTQDNGEGWPYGSSSNELFCHASQLDASIILHSPVAAFFVSQKKVI